MTSKTKLGAIVKRVSVATIAGLSLLFFGPLFSSPVTAQTIGPAQKPPTPLAPTVKVPVTTTVAPPQREASIPVEAISVLSEADVALYRQIFEAQDKRDWGQADRLIKRLSDRALIGHVLFERYLHLSYKSSYDELQRWMANYADHPGAERIYKLAVNRRYKNAPKLAAPVPLGEAPPPDTRTFTKAELDLIRALRDARADIQGHLKKNEPTKAEARFWVAKERNLFDKEAFGATLSRIAGAYFYAGNDKKALSLGTISGANPGRGGYDGNWIAGLAAWRGNDCARSADHFEKAAKAAGEDPWRVSSASFWAARARLACREPAVVNNWLDQAAKHNKTFYGLVAARQLGRDVTFSWDHPPLTKSDYARVLREKPAHRAVGLWQVGLAERADLEMRFLWRRSDEALHPQLLGLASRLNLPSTQVRGAKSLERKQIASSDSALYPVPEWAPKGGFKVDQALILAFMRQESEFFTRAVSSAGARGLMQLMPTTASYIGRDQTLEKQNNERLYDPAFNMELGQRYIEYLMGKNDLGKNLFFVASAYNGGPGNLARWLRTVNFKDDPLLFLETIPLEETRDYVEKVMANLWVYQMRMGQSVPSLDAVASGEWPIYTN